jgi:hypothetical protein
MNLNEIAENIEINETNLSEELSKQSAFYLQIASAYVNSEADHLQAKEDHEVTYANLDSTIRQQFAEANTKVTEKVVESSIKQTDEYKEARDKVTKAKIKAELLKAHKESWWMRKDCLIQLCIKQRAEFEQVDMSVKQAYN